MRINKSLTLKTILYENFTIRARSTTSTAGGDKRIYLGTSRVTTANDLRVIVPNDAAQTPPMHPRY